MPNRLYRDANGVLQPKIVSGGLPDSTITSAELVDGTIVLADIADGAITNAKINASAGIVSSKLVLNDTTAIVKNTADPTKTAVVDISGATTAKALTIISSHTDNRSITIPDATDTLVGKATTDILTNKTLSGATITDATDIVIGSTTGTKIGTATTQKIGFYNEAPVVQPTALTTAETTLTFVNENTPDFALSSLTTTASAGFASLDEAQAFVEVVVNMQTRIGELETKLQSLGLLA